MKFQSLFFGRLVLTGALVVLAGSAAVAAALELGTRRELFVDHYLIDRLDGVRLKMGQPQPREVALRFEEPWEMPFAGCLSVIKDGDIYRMYYRGAGANAQGQYEPELEFTCYAESRDGIHWLKPKLGLHEFRGSKANNIILAADVQRRISATFAPFLDDRPGVPADERYKGVGGQGGDRSIAMGPDGRGLYRLASADGIHWRILPGPSLFQGYALDTLNLAFWSPAEKTYVAYIRTWSEGGTPDKPKFAGYRTISRSVSKDFVTWSEPKRMTFGDAPPEHIYTNATHPYFRAPHILISLPFRYEPLRKVLSDVEHRTLQTHYTQRIGISDAILMTSRGGTTYDRTFLEAFIRPGLERGAWGLAATCPAWEWCRPGRAKCPFI